MKRNTINQIKAILYEFEHDLIHIEMHWRRSKSLTKQAERKAVHNIRREIAKELIT